MRRTLLLTLAGLLAALWLSDVATGVEPPGRMSPVAASAPYAVPPLSAPSADPGEEECGWLDPGCQAGKAVTDWIGNLAMSGLKPVLGFLAHTGFSTPQIGTPAMERAERIWSASLTIANTSAVLLVTLGGVLLLTGASPTGQPSPAAAVTRLVAGFVAANLSLIVIGYAIQLANGLSEAILLDGADTIDPSKAGQVLAHGIQTSINGRGVFYGVVSLIVVGLATVLLVQYLLRLAIIMILIGIAPLALILHSLELTDPIARLWWRGIAGVMAIQVCQSFVFVTTLGMLLSPDSTINGEFFGIPSDQSELLNLLLIAALLWVLLRIPSLVSRSIWQSAPGRPRIIGQLVRTFLLYKGVGAISSALKVKSAARVGGAGGPGRAGGGGRRRPPPGPSRPGPARGGPSPRGPGGGGPGSGGRPDGPRPRPEERPNRPSGNGPQRPRNDDGGRPDRSGRRPQRPDRRPQGTRRDRTPVPAPHHRPSHRPSHPNPRAPGPRTTPAATRATTARTGPRAPAAVHPRPAARTPTSRTSMRLDPPRRSRTHRHGRA